MPPLINVKNMAKKTTGPSFDAVRRDVLAGNFRPIYCLAGEENYYIDILEELIVDNALKPEARDFNMMTFYGPDSKIEDIITAARSYPMGADRLLVVVKEAQGLSHIDRLEVYLRSPQPSTVMVLCYRSAKLDHRLKYVGLIEKNGVLFVSEKLKQGMIPVFVQNFLSQKQLAIEPDAAYIMAEYVGNDLSRLVRELEKLVVAVSEGTTRVTKDLVMSVVGINKDYNRFELQDALVTKDVERAMKIVNYFDKNEKQFPIFSILPSLATFFRNLLLAYYSPEKTEQGIAATLGISPWQVQKNYLPAMRVYSAQKVFAIISAIRRTDAKSKGVGKGPNVKNGDLLKELFYFILH